MCFILAARRTRDAVDCHRVVAIATVIEKDIVFTLDENRGCVTRSRASDGKQMIDR